MSFVSHESIRLVSAGQGRAFDSFLIHVARRSHRRRAVEECVHADLRKNTYVQWCIDRLRSRARSKGIGGYLALSFICVNLALRSCCSAPRCALAVFVFPASPFLPVSLLVLAYFVDRPLPASANLRSEKLIACPSTCPCVPHLLPAPPPCLPKTPASILVVTHPCALTDAGFAYVRRCTYVVRCGSERR